MGLSLFQFRTNGPSRPLVLGDILAPECNSFGLIRIAMAVAVLFSHSYLLQSGMKISEPLYRWTGHSLGEHAVQVFFFLSGILIAQSFDRSRDLRDFVTARALRIMPALGVCVLLTAFVLGPLATTLARDAYLQDQRLADYIVKTIGLWTGAAPLPGVFADNPMANSVNISLWTLKYEVACYAALALLGLAGLFRPQLRWPAIALMALALATLFSEQPKPGEFYSQLDNARYLALYFFVGTFAYLLRRFLIVHWALALPLVALYIVAIGTRFREPACALMIGYMTLVIASWNFGRLTTFTREHDYSFGTYIYAAPIQQLLLMKMPGLDPIVLSLWALAATLPLAYLSWELIERPALALRRGIDGGRRTAEASASGADMSLNAGSSVSAMAVDPALAVEAATWTGAVMTTRRSAAVAALDRTPASGFKWPRRTADPVPLRVFADGAVFQGRLGSIARGGIGPALRDIGA